MFDFQKVADRKHASRRAVYVFVFVVQISHADYVS